MSMNMSMATRPVSTEDFIACMEQRAVEVKSTGLAAPNPLSDNSQCAIQTFPV